MQKNVLLALLILTILIVGSIGAQAALDARAIGLGDNFVALEGEEAYYSNPALIGLRDNTWSYKGNFGGTIWNNIFNNSEFTEDEIESKLSSEDLILGGRTMLGNQLYFKNFAIGINGRAEGMMRTNSDLIELITGDNQVKLLSGESVEIPLTGTNGGASVATDISLSYATAISDDRIELINKDRKNKIDAIYFGTTYHYLEGDVYKFAGQGKVSAVYNSASSSKVTYTLENDPQIFAYQTDDGNAKGSSFDLGMHVKMENKYSFGFSVMNIGEIKADSGYKEGTSFQIKGAPSATTGAEIDEVDTSKTDYNQEITWQLPRIIRLGGSMDYNEDVTFFADYANTNYDNGETENQVSLGAEASWSKRFPLRMGLNYSSLREDVSLATGMGIYFKNFKIDMGIADIGALFDSSQSVTGGISTTLEF